MSVTRYFLILSLAVLGQVAVSADQGAVVTGDRVNVRSDISTNADIIEKATKGAKYIAVERDTINPPIEGMPANWIKVRLNSSPVYIKSNLLNEDGSAKTTLNLREGPGTTYKKVGQLKQGEKVVVLGTVLQVGIHADAKERITDLQVLVGKECGQIALLESLDVCQVGSHGLCALAVEPVTVHCHLVQVGDLLVNGAELVVGLAQLQEHVAQAVLVLLGQYVEHAIAGPHPRHALPRFEWLVLYQHPR